MKKITLSLTSFVSPAVSAFRADGRTAVMEFHIRREVREQHHLDHPLFSLTGNVVLADIREARSLAAKLNAGLDPVKDSGRFVRAGQLNAMGLIDEILHYLVALYREQAVPGLFEEASAKLEERLGEGRISAMLRHFGNVFPPQAVYAGKISVDAYLGSSEGEESCKSLSLEELLLLAIANLNPAFRPFLFMFGDADLSSETVYPAAIEELKAFFAALPVFGPDGQNLWDLLRAPALASPDSLSGQIEFMRKKWGLLLGRFMARLLTSLDVIKEEEKPSFLGPGPSEVYTYGCLENEYERFSPDQDWMPRTVLMAKSTLVWLFQLSQKYGRAITRLDEIPDEELDELASRGFTGLWLIGLWERSAASRTIKQWTGNPEAAASAYSLYDYDIASELGGWGALARLRERAMRRGIRLGSDMVPNHTGLDSRWIVEHPDRFLQLPYSPFPQYAFNCGNLSGREDITVQIEEHYFTRSDAAVVFRHIDNRTGQARFIYHGNDGTSMPWNDTAQIDFLNPEAREAVIRTIIGVCRQFPIVRFDAAMTLAKRHIQRLWYPEPGRGGDIASRAEHAIGADEFNRRIPNEFWREVVDRCAEEAPGTLLLAEAFWMMEGYFVRTLGMHRVYNSAFMNMLKNEENAKYRETIKNTLEFDPEILKRFVNFMNNPDEDTAVAQFGKGDKYFGICTLLVTMPGLPMFGHGQIEGFEEKYGMEYRRSYRNEQPDRSLVERHEREIFPLMKKRRLFSGSAEFRLYELRSEDGANENVFAYTNRDGGECAMVLYNNSYQRASGWIAHSAAGKDGLRGALADALGLHCEDGCFVLLRELRCGLWFIRSSKDIVERGLFAALDGYQAQVFLDIREVRDDEYGYWARLHHELSGRGVPDPEEAKMDLVLAGLYAAFDELLQAGSSYVKALRKGKKEKALAKAPSGKDQAETLRLAALHFAGAAVEYGAFAGLTFTAVPDPVFAGEHISAYLERAACAENTLEPWPEIAAGFAAFSALRTILGAGGREAARAAVCWQLPRKLAAYWESVHAVNPRRLADLAAAVLARTAPETKPAKTAAKTKVSSALTPGIAAAAIIAANYDDEDFRRFLGINRFNDITWFNKEAFEETINAAAAFLLPELDEAFAGASISAFPDFPAGKERAAFINAIVKALFTAEKDSGYQFETLVELLSKDRGRKDEKKR